MTGLDQAAPGGALRDPGAARSPGSKARVAIPFALGAVAVLALLVRVASINEPLAVDQSFWASIARGLARGEMLYRDLWDHRPPGTFLLYLGAFRVFGWTPAAIVWADILASAATALLLVVILRRTNTLTMALASAALFLALTMPAWTSREGGVGQRAIAETFIAALVAWGAWCAIRLARRPSTTIAASLGLGMGAVVLLKPNAGVYLPALWIWLALYRDKTAGSFLRVVVVSALASLVLPALALAWIGSRGALPEAYAAVVEFNRRYVGDFAVQAYAVAFAKAVWLRAKIDPLWTAGCVGALVAIWDLARLKKIEPVPALAIAWGAASVLVIVSNGSRLYGTYFIQALPPLALLGAWLLAGAATRSLVHRLAACVAIAVMLKVLVTHHYPAKVYRYASAGVQYAAGRMDRGTYLRNFGGYANQEGYSALANDELATYVRAHTAPGDRIFLFGMNGTGVYLQADRLPAHRLLRLNFFVPGGVLPGRTYSLAGVADALAAARPAYLIFEHLYAPEGLREWTEGFAQQPDVARLLRSYHLDTQIEDFTLYRRVD